MTATSVRFLVHSLLRHLQMRATRMCGTGFNSSSFLWLCLTLFFFFFFCTLFLCCGSCGRRLTKSVREFAEKRSCLLTAARHLLFIFPLCMELFKGALSLSLLSLSERKGSILVFQLFFCVCVRSSFCHYFSINFFILLYMCGAFFFFFKIVYLNVPFFFLAACF